MSDFISRQAVVELIEGWWLGHTKEDDLATEVKKLPSVTPKPNKGEWQKQYTEIDDIEYEHRNVVCSKCGHSSKYKFPFCPWCGADMRGEE